ncbi:hypothetical protein COU36_04335 [Candidatus Micrarchaeota archaeon CG10_big_fil_rev_8_21_14_0_10_59_7]|nr:MAG: hypothetical protein COU36_04335 [Candidatus Micrarchaeota archaeon CG10_big_fil_rev_8_21_14_0_10_59_7]
MGDEEGGDLKGKFGGLLEKAKETVNRIGAKRIVVGALLVVILIWGVFLRPVPGKISVSVVELDNEEQVVSGAQVYLLNADGKMVGSEVTDEAGRAEFRGAPADAELTIEVDAGAMYKTLRGMSVRLESGGSSSLEAKMERATSLDLKVANVPNTVGAGCGKSVAVEVTNLDEEPADIEFIGGGELEGRVFAPSEQLAGKTSKTYIVQIRARNDKAGDSISGMVRLKYTRKGFSVDMNVVEKSDFKLSPSTIKSNINAGETLKEYITITNTGKSEDIDDLSFTVAGDIKDWTTVTMTNNDPIRPKEEKIATINVDAGGSGGKYLGQIIFSTSCVTKPVPIEIAIKSG